MAYATQQDLVDRFGERRIVQLTDEINRPASTIDTTKVARAIVDAEAAIDGYVGKVYALPLDPVPARLTKVAADLAHYFLTGDRAEKDDATSRAYHEAIAWLRDVSRGLVRLDAAGVEPEQPSGDVVSTSLPNRVFTRDSLKRM